MIKNGEQGAFACASENVYQEGVTKREYFAGLAMQGFCACISPESSLSAEDLAKAAVIRADALLKALQTWT